MHILYRSLWLLPIHRSRCWHVVVRQVRVCPSHRDPRFRGKETGPQRMQQKLVPGENRWQNNFCSFLSFLFFLIEKATRETKSEMQEARILVRKPKEEKISPHTWHGQGLLDGGSLRDACTATVAVAEFCFGWYWEVIQGSLNGTHFEGVELDAYNVAGSFEGYPLKKKIALFGLAIHHDPCDLRSSIPKWMTVFGLQKKESPKFVCFWLESRGVECRKCWEGDDRGGSEKADSSFYKRMVGCLLFHSSHHTGSHMTLTQLFGALDQIHGKFLSPHNGEVTFRFKGKYIFFSYDHVGLP